MRKALNKSKRLAQEIERWQAKLAPELRSVHPDDLQLVLWSILRRKSNPSAFFRPVATKRR